MIFQACWCSRLHIRISSHNFRPRKADPLPIIINGDYVEKVCSFKFLGIYLSDSLSWSTNTTAAVKKAQQRLHFLRVLKKKPSVSKTCKGWSPFSLLPLLPIESVLTYCLLAGGYGGCSVSWQKALAEGHKERPTPEYQWLPSSPYDWTLLTLGILSSRDKKHCQGLSSPRSPSVFFPPTSPGRAIQVN